MSLTPFGTDIWRNGDISFEIPSKEVIHAHAASGVTETSVSKESDFCMLSPMPLTPQAVAPLLGVGLPCLVMGALAECTNIWYTRRPMGRNTSITLGPHFDEFIAAQVENGRYGSASEVVRAGLRLLEETESKLERLRRLLDEGEQSGIADYSLESVIAELDNEAH